MVRDRLRDRLSGRVSANVRDRDRVRERSMTATVRCDMAGYVVNEYRLSM